VRQEEEAQVIRRRKLRSAVLIADGSRALRGLARPGISLSLPLVALAILAMGAGSASASVVGPSAKVWAKLSALRNPDGSVTARAVFKSKERACALKSTSKGHARGAVFFSVPAEFRGVPSRTDPAIQQNPPNGFPMVRVGRGVLEVTVPATTTFTYDHWTGTTNEALTATVSQAIFARPLGFISNFHLKSGVLCRERESPPPPVPFGFPI
jgi:hypothetical protein